MSADPTGTVPPHVHEFAPNGLVRENATISKSPASDWDTLIGVKVFSIGLCPCGEVNKVHVSNENVHRQGDDWRRDYQQAELARAASRRSEPRW